MERKTNMPVIARSILSIVLILLAFSTSAGATDSLQKGNKDKVQDHADEAQLSNIKNYCATTLGPGYFLQVQKTHNGGYLFICAQKDDNGKGMSYLQLVRQDRRANKKESVSFYLKN